MDKLDASGRNAMKDGKYRILITGTSSGFGKLTAVTLALAGHHVIAGMRDPNGKNAAAKADLLAKCAAIEIVDLDVTSDESVNTAVAHIDNKAGGIDVLVNNAGLSVVGISEAVTMEQTRALFEVNVFGVQRMNRAVLPIMRRAGSGLLIHVSSSLGRVVLPLLTVYEATKFALECLAEGYRYELAPAGIESIVVEPGAFPTNITANMLIASDTDRNNGYPALVPALNGMMAMFEGMAKDPNAPNPQNVADAIARLVEMDPGTRPIRTSVDGQMGPLVEIINRTTDQVQTQALTAMGMAGLLTPNVARKD